MEVLKDIAFQLDIDTLLARLRVDKDSKDAKGIQHLIDHVGPLVKPKAVYEVCYIDYKGYDTVNIGGVIFTSRVLRVNLDQIERVFPYVATCGKELEGIVAATDDFMRRFWLDTIKGTALDASRKYLRNYLKRKYALGQISSMSPGSASPNLWPIDQQGKLFSIFGDVEDLIGVKLTDSFLMIPNKSVSGIYFPTEIKFESCQLCPRKGCPARRAPYKKNLLETKYYKGLN